MKKFTINADSNGQMIPCVIWIGEPEAKHHPLEFQQKFLSEQKGIMIPTDIMEALSKLQELARKNNVPLQDLCVYALGAAEDDEREAPEQQEIQEDISENPAESNQSQTDADETSVGDHIINDEAQEDIITSDNLAESDQSQTDADEISAGDHIINDEAQENNTEEPQK